MRRQRTRIDSVLIERNTNMARTQVDNAIARAEMLSTDSERDQRLQAQECKYCWYLTRPRVGGAAITARECSICGTDQTFSSTNTDPLCKPCAHENSLCCHCGGDIDMKNRRKPRPFQEKS